MKCFDVKMENSKAGRIWGILSLIDSVVSQQLFHKAKINAEMVFWGHSCRRDCGEFQWKSSRIVKNLIFKTQGTKKRCLLFILSKKLKRNLMFYCQDSHRPWFLVPWLVLCCSPESILLLWLELACWERGSLVSHVTFVVRLSQASTNTRAILQMGFRPWSVRNKSTPYKTSFKEEWFDASVVTTAMAICIRSKLFSTKRNG